MSDIVFLRYVTIMIFVANTLLSMFILMISKRLFRKFLYPASVIFFGMFALLLLLGFGFIVW